MIDTTRGFTLVRELDATPERIWNAWTDPDEVAEWWHPRGFSTPRETVEIDARVGGRYRYTMVDDLSEQRYPTGGSYREVQPHERLVFTWGDPDEAVEEMLVTVTIEALGELSRLTFDLRGAEGTSGDGSFYDGWESALDSLVEHLGQREVLG